MAYMDDLLRELEARNLTGKIYNAGSSSSQSSNSTQKKKKKDYTEELLTILSEDAKKNGVKLELSDYGTISADSFKAPMDDIAPVKTTVKKSEEADDGLLDFFQKGALGEIDLRKNFRDGYQFGDILKTGGHVAGQVGKAILGTAGDVGLGVAKGFASSAEGIADLASYGIAAGLDALGKDDTAERWRKNASENTVEEWTKGADEYLNRYSMAGRTTDAISQGIGQIGSIIATGGLGKAAGLGAKAVTALTTGTMGLSGMGAGMGEAYRSGATDEEAATYGLIAGASDALTELLFGGLGKAVGAVGLSTGLSSADDLLAKKVSGLFTKQIDKNFAEYGIKAGAEGFEEVLAGTAQAIGKKITYMKEEELSEILKDENLLEQFVVGAAASGLMQSGMIPGMTEGSLKEANAEGRDFITGLNQTEQTVIDKEVAKRVAAEEEKSGTKLTKKEIGKIEKTVQEDMDKGYISIDTIEEALGGETYTNYKKVVDAEEKMQREYDELGKKEKYTLADDARYKELGERLKYVREKGAKNELRKRLDEQVSSMVKDSRLTESFAERSRRGQAFEADLTQYTNEKQRAIVQKAVESGVLNNTNRTREFVNMVSKIAADKDISFDFANNAKLKETGFAVEGKTVNGFVTKDGITVNIQSAKALNSVVGHEITHVLEGTELYTELQTAAIEYAKTKGDYQGRYDALVKVYESVEGADIDAELTADIVGDYLFTDSDFINNLSTSNRNLFQKIYDEVKYLLKVATAGSKEARELEKVKRAFEKAYREGAKNNTAEDGGRKYSLASDSEGRQLSAEQREYFKDSKVVDESGRLKVMYHGTQDGGFHEFSGGYSDDGISFFFADSNEVASSYSGTDETYAARTLRTADDLNALFTEVGATEYSATEKGGTFYLLEDGEEVAESDSAEGLYEEFRDWTGLGSGSVNYQAYLNIVNPLVVDADGADWHALPSIDRASDKYDYIKIVEVLDKGVRIEYSMVGDPAPITEVVDLYDKFDDNLADTLSNMAPGEVLEGANANPATTRDYAQYAKENGYDGVIFKNIYDIGGYGGGGATESTVAIAFSPEQIKSVANAKPTADPDIRRSLSGKGEQQRTFGNYNVYGRDIALEEDIAPVRQDIAPATVSKNATVEDAVQAPAPVQAEEDIAPMPTPPGERVTDEEVAAAQAAWASIDAKQREYDELVDEYEELERQVYEAYEIGDHETATELNADLMDAAARFSQLKQQIEEETDAFEQMHSAVYANEQERLASFGDADAPAMREAPYQESTDNVTLPDKRRNNLAAEVRKVLGFSTKRVAEMRQLIDKFATNEIDGDDLYAEIKLRFGTITEKTRQEDIAEVRNWLRTTRLNVSDEIKSDFPDYGDSVFRANRGRILFAKDGADVDMYYAELADKFPGFFPADIINPADQLERIIEVANMDINTEMQYEIDERMLDDVTDNIIMQVNEYRQEQRRLAAQANSAAARNSLLAYADRYAPAEDGDIGPVRADAANVADGDMGPVRADVAAATQQESADGFVPDKRIRTIPERLEAELQSYQTELQNVKQLREEAKARMEQDIAKKQAEYDNRKNKNTQEAQKNLQSVQRLIGQASRIDARYDKRISDLEGKVAKASEAVREGESKEAQGAMRRELHDSIIEEFHTEFGNEGEDFDEALKNAKNLSTFQTVDNTPERVNEKTFGYKTGQIINRLTIDRVRQHTSEGVKWLNSITNRKNGLLAQLSKQYNIKPRSNESKAAQMYAEGYFVDGNGEKVAYGDRELALDFPDLQVQANIKGLARDPRIRQFYDETLAKINDSRTRNAYPAIKPLQNYFLHFHAMEDTFSRLGIPFNPNDIKAKDLPTDMNGMTADLKPGQPYFSSAKHRRGFDTTFDLLGGLERYAVSAMPQMYLIDDIQTHRALRNYIADTFGQAKGLEGLDTMSEEEVAERLKEVYGAHLSNYARFLTEEANVLAGKTAMTDRALEGIFGRRGMAFMDTLNKQVGANMVGFNVSSALTNFLAPVQAFAKSNKASFVKAFAQTVANRVGAIAGKTDGFAENNPTMIRRQGADRFSRTPWQKIGDAGYLLMGAVDSFSTEIIVRAHYNELVKRGVSSEQAIEMADKWATRLMGDRSTGLQPQIFNSKTLGIVTKFQLEVRNQLDAMFYDTIQEKKLANEDIENGLKRNAKTAAQVTSTLVQLAVTQHLFGKAFEAVAGYNPAFDIIEAIIKAFGWDDEEDSEDTVLDNLGQGLASIAEDLPYYSVIKDGGRIPISSALPVSQLIKGEDKYGNEKNRWEIAAEAAPYWLLPGGASQIKKTTQGLGMFDDDLPIAGSYTDSGNLRYPVEDTLANRVQAAVFGQYASSNARDYFDNERQSLKKNQIQELVDVDIPIREYWDYREGLNEQETLAEKFDYIAGLDLPIDKKNILINNVVDRKEAVDLTDYDQYADYEEFDFAVKNPEKYDFLQSVGVSVGEYNSFDDDTKDAYNWAYQNPEKYTLSRAVSDDVAVYRQYTKALNDISADKDADGKSISGSRKAKVIDYLNGLDADYYSKLILFKMEYNADDTYNNEIIEYLNGRNDISFEEEVTILRELGFTVTADGTVRW